MPSLVPSHFYSNLGSNLQSGSSNCRTFSPNSGTGTVLPGWGSLLFFHTVAPTTPTLSDSAGNPYSVVASSTSASNALYIFYSPSILHTITPSTVFTATQGVSQAAEVIFYAIPGGQAVDIASPFSGPGPTINANLPAPGNLRELQLFIISNNTENTVFGATPPWTLFGNNFGEGNLVSLGWSTYSGTNSFTGSTTGQWNAVSLAIPIAPGLIPTTGITVPVNYPLSLEDSGAIGTIQTGFASEFNILLRKSASVTSSFKVHTPIPARVNAGFNTYQRLQVPLNYSTFSGDNYTLDKSVVSPISVRAFQNAPEFSWNVRARTSVSMTSKFNAYPREGKTRNCLFNTTQRVTSTNKQSLFNTHGFVTKQQQSLFNTHKLVSPVLTSSFNTRRALAIQRVSLFNTLLHVTGPQKTCLFNTRNKITKAQQSLFNVSYRVHCFGTNNQYQGLLQPVDHPISWSSGVPLFQWDVHGIELVTSLLPSSFNIHGLNRISEGFLFNVHGPTLVTASTASTFNVRATTRARKTSLFNVRIQVSQTKHYLFNTHGLITKQQQSLFNQRAIVSPTLSSQFNALARRNVLRGMQFNALQRVAPGQSQTFSFKVHGKLTAPLSSAFNTMQRIFMNPDHLAPVGALNRPVVYPIDVAWAPQMPTFDFNVYKKVLVTQRSLFNARQRVTKSQQMLFNTGYDHVPMSSGFNVMQRVMVTRGIPFNTLQKAGPASITMEWNVGEIVQAGLRTIGRTKWISTYPG